MPIIDVVDLNASDAGSRFAKTLRETGFAVLKNHPVDQTLITDVYEQWAAFFASDGKYDYAPKDGTQAGFISQAVSETAKGNNKKDIKEFFQYYSWGPCPNQLRENSEALRQQLNTLATTLLISLEESLPNNIQQQLSMPLHKMIERSQRHMLRVIHYPPLNGNEPTGSLRAADHTDIDLLTLLPAATAAGLQAKMSNGEWVDVPIDSNWIVVNAGDMLQECTQHFYPSTIHRVQNPTGEAAKKPRLSMPLFFHAQDDVVLSDKHTANSYLLERIKEIGIATTVTKIES